MNNKLDFSTYKFDRLLILIHYIALFGSVIVASMILESVNYILARLSAMILVIVLGFALSTQVWEIRYNENAINFLSWFGKYRQIRWKEIDSLVVYSYGRSVFKITSGRNKIKIDTYYCRKDASNILNIIVENAQLVIGEAKWPNQVLYVKVDPPASETTDH